jgi:hypothetical protein
MSVGLLRRKKIKAFFKDLGFPARVSKKYAENQGFNSIDAFWEDANRQYEDALENQQKGKRIQQYEVKKTYNRERNQRLREATKRITVDVRDYLKNDNYYNKQKPIWEGKSKQREINSKPKAFMQKMMELQNDGRFTVKGSPSEMWNALQGLNGRHHVSYITKGGLYRAGGFLRISKDDDVRSKMEKQKYITVAQPSLGLSWPVQLNDIDVFYIKEVKPKISEIKPTDMKPTNFPVEINGVVVYYAKDSWKQSRFKSTAKYRAMLEHAAKSSS